MPTSGFRAIAFYWLEQAYSHRDIIGTGEPLDYILVDPMVHPGAHRPEIQALVRRIGLPPQGQ